MNNHLKAQKFCPKNKFQSKAIRKKYRRRRNLNKKFETHLEHKIVNRHKKFNLNAKKTKDELNEYVNITTFSEEYEHVSPLGDYYLIEPHVTNYDMNKKIDEMYLNVILNQYILVQ